MDDEQFKELMECLEGISSRLDAIESAVSGVEVAVTAVEASQPDYCAYSLEDVVKALWEFKDAVIDNG